MTVLTLELVMQFQGLKIEAQKRQQADSATTTITHIHPESPCCAEQEFPECPI